MAMYMRITAMHPVPCYLISDPWDAKMMAALDVPASVLPNVLPSSGYFGETDLFGASIPICGIAGDQAALWTRHVSIGYG